MNSVTQAAPYVFPLMGAAAVVALVIQIFIKPVLNHFLTQGTANQNAAVRASVYAVALLVVLASQFLHYQLNSRSDIASALGAASVVAGLAITSFHVLTSDDLPALPLAAIQGKAPAPAPPVPGPKSGVSIPVSPGSPTVTGTANTP